MMHPSDALEMYHSNCPDPICRAQDQASYIQSRAAVAPEPNSGSSDCCTRKWLRIVLCICSAGLFGLATSTFGYCLHILLNMIYPTGLVLSNLSITIWLFIGITIFIVFVSLFGFYVSWRNQKQAKLFALGLAVAFILLFPTLCYVDIVRRHTLAEGNDKTLHQALVAVANKPRFTKFTQQKKKCCGVTSYLDWKVKSFDCSTDNSSRLTIFIGCHIPNSCCMKNQMKSMTYCEELLHHSHFAKEYASELVYFLNACDTSVLINTLCWHLMTFAILLLVSLVVSVITIAFFLFMLQKEGISLLSEHDYSIEELPSIFGEIQHEAETAF